ncbi:CCA tRNA nucleotidyltransferase [[Clostridium] polysaccharolyticum]|uniref:tRNA nucleotidyltransferase (CCA-adding enzyme) n=1 Tax=[Clostridium] polysaccharolyticum TaxID=29364 RepID=A0A1I0FYJ9_9FIRM|nr:CCA tRNA nucleotidyltransferase [[Clostridium] polysaccharolyticum]SET63507.1 tRNA nucleotidyltransferase (CCA-adding enzyme) [[Clostridium] polysaccharolyticum]
MFIAIPEKVEFILNKLLDSGYEAYAVGGCVRDVLLDRIPGDWDITTSAKPEQVKKLFKRTIDTGIQHGTVTVMLEKEGFEVTTYRIDGEYEDSRHPKSVEFTTNLIEDLKRRDFTINAMAYNHVTGIVDKFGGMEDLKRKRIVCVGNPEERFSEDALRMLRAIRFSGQLGFEIEEHTKDAIAKLASTIQNISAERIRVELDKLLCAKYPDRFFIAHKTGLTDYILPEFNLMMDTPQNNPNHIDVVGVHCIKALLAFHNEVAVSGQYKELYDDHKLYSALCWAIFLHDVGKPAMRTTDENGVDHFRGHDEEGSKMVKIILKRLKFDNYTVNMVSQLIRWHDYRYELTPKAIRRAMNKIGGEIIFPLISLQYADVLAQSSYQKEAKLIRLEKSKKLMEERIANKEAFTLKDLAVNGNDLIKAGVAPGKEVGDVLKSLLERVLEDPEQNQKEILLNSLKLNKN